MDKQNEYPLMLYLGGDGTADYRIVEDADGEKAAKAEGFQRHKPAQQLAKEREAKEAAEAAKAANAAGNGSQQGGRQ